MTKKRQADEPMASTDPGDVDTPDPDVSTGTETATTDLERPGPTGTAPSATGDPGTAPSKPDPPRDGLVLETRALAKDYGDGMGLTTGLDLSLEPGELVMLVGPNGAGKSTLLGLCSGLIEPSGGTAFVQGKRIGSIEARAATSYLPDAPVLYDDLSVNEHLEYIARLHRTENWEEYADDLLEMFNLTSRADDLPSRFSRGLKQKTALILGLIRPFSLLLVDEPFVGLDTPGQETLVDVLSDVTSQGATVLVSTHQLDLVDAATRCVGLRDGELVYDGPATVDEIRSLVGG